MTDLTSPDPSPGTGDAPATTGRRTLAGRTLLMSGGSRGIGLEIALRAAEDGANVVLLAKTDTPDPRLPGTVHTAVDAIEQAGGRGLAVVGDVRNDEDVQRAVGAAVERFGGVDIVVNNASAINLADTDSVDMKRYDLMQDINARGTFLLSKTAIPQLSAAAVVHGAAHILTLSPPLNLDPRWAGAHLAYTMAKYGMSLTTLGLAHELAERNIAVNSLWPATMIDTAAIRNMPGGERLASRSRKPRIVAEAAHAILTRDASYTGHFALDEEVLGEEGIADFTAYNVGEAEQPRIRDEFLESAPGYVSIMEALGA